MTNNFTSSAYTPADQVHSTSIFSHVFKNVFSKSFKGGVISNVFGATEIDLTQADINGVAVLNISQAFGQTIIIIPAEWAIDTHLSQFCSAVSDERINRGLNLNTNKVLIIKGLSIFSNVEVVSIA